MGLGINGGAGAGVGVLFFFLILSLLTCRGQSAGSSTVAALSVLQSESSSGVIRLNDTLLRRIATLPTPRPFHFLIFFDAQKLHSRSELGLLPLQSEFSILSSSFLANHPNNTSHLFFFHVEVDESPATFTLFGVQTLPHIRLIPSDAADLKTNSIKLDASQFSTLADSLSELIYAKTTVSVGPIHRPPLLSKTQMTIAAVIAVIWAPYLVKTLVSGKSILHRKSIWMAATILVYFFSVSGAMFNIIRKAPMFMRDRRDREKVVFFYQGSSVQLGVEGLSVGFLYTVVGLLMAAACHVVVGVRDSKWQRISMFVILGVSVWAVREVIFLINWKTGYHVHAYWPSAMR